MWPSRVEWHPAGWGQAKSTGTRKGRRQLRQEKEGAPRPYRNRAGRARSRAGSAPAGTPGTASRGAGGDEVREESPGDLVFTLFERQERIAERLDRKIERLARRLDRIEERGRD